MSLQTTGGKDELNIVCIQKSQRTSQDGTENVKTHNRTTQKLRKLTIILLIFTVKLSFSLLLQLSSQTVSCSNIITFGHRSYSENTLPVVRTKCPLDTIEMDASSLRRITLFIRGRHNVYTMTLPFVLIHVLMSFCTSGIRAMSIQNESDHATGSNLLGRDDHTCHQVSNQ